VEPPPKETQGRPTVEIRRIKIDLTTDFHNITKMLANVSTRALGADFNRVQIANDKAEPIESYLQDHTNVWFKVWPF
jgi:hypothetical protein